MQVRPPDHLQLGSMIIGRSALETVIPIAKWNVER